MSFVDDILELKSRCILSQEIGHDFGLSAKEIECICAVGRREQLHSKTLSHSVSLSASRGSRIVNRLIGRGFMESLTDENDKRYLNVRLTRAGIECRRSIEARKCECERKLLADLDESERKTVQEGLRLLLKVI